MIENDDRHHVPQYLIDLDKIHTVKAHKCHSIMVHRKRKYAFLMAETEKREISQNNENEEK